ncbi:hypothetical protein F5148DRAFT_996446 [Russula earlei]|uniref:Uncharacterized protein n=1 Tax=Russula earlei TaxID=71964 RepID=A0ACC0UFC3_9AGAM|nr:hypothetical protein F5148DRAFT_996446 [Russula earlei]
MARFEDLPIEILPLIVDHVLGHGNLASLCLVSRAFHEFTVSRLYRRVAIFPWNRFSKSRVTQLFRTLSECPNLSRLVHQLVIRDFPKIQGFDSVGTQAADWYTKGLENCVQLQVCAWTRYGSLTSDILKSLGKCHKLTDITINGEHSWNYEPVDLLQLFRLSKISLIMPSTPVLDILPRWLQAIRGPLTSLTLVCKACLYSMHALLESISPYLSHIQRLHLAGCPRVTHEGIWSTIRNNIENMKDLSLEYLSPALASLQWFSLQDMLMLGRTCMNVGGLTSLLSFTLATHPKSLVHSWMNGTELLLKASPLEIFQIYVPDSAVEGAAADMFCVRIVEQHRDRLSMFSFHPQRIGLGVIEDVCISCLRLEELFVVIYDAEMVLLIPALAQAKRLRTVHLRFVDRPLVNGLTYAWDVVHQCGTTISLVGIGAEVWRVEKRATTVEGVVRLDCSLIKVDNSDIPERVLVVRM